MESPDGHISRPTDPDGLVLEAWGQGLMVGSLVVMVAVIVANMKTHIPLQKLILAELILAIPHGTFIFNKPPIYGWYLSLSAVGLNIFWSLHNVIAWMKTRPFYSRRVSRAYIVTVLLVQPYWVLEIYANFTYFNNINRMFQVMRLLEPLFRYLWWICITCSLFYTIKCGYNFGIVELVTVSPRFGIMLASIVLGVFSSASLPIGVQPFWKLSFILECLCNTVILDDFKLALDRIHAYRVQKQARMRASLCDIVPANTHPRHSVSACQPTEEEAFVIEQA
ncbi:hypothetical protein BDV12DRAFT_188263 [Aspergillus spectabilis]